MSAERLAELEARITALEERNTRAEAEQLRMKYYVCRRIWKLRDTIAPGLEDEHGTWGQWFLRRFGEPIEQFAERAKETNLKQVVLEYELATFGKSALNGTASVEGALPQSLPTSNATEAR